MAASVNEKTANYFAVCFQNIYMPTCFSIKRLTFSLVFLFICWPIVINKWLVQKTNSNSRLITLDRFAHFVKR